MVTVDNFAREGHTPDYLRYSRGKSVPWGRPVYGYRVRCSCGQFERRVNGTRAEAAKHYREHIVDLGHDAEKLLQGHQPTLLRFAAGERDGRPVYGYRVRCSCGELDLWVAGRKPAAAKAHLEHLRQVLVAARAGQPAVV